MIEEQVVDSELKNTILQFVKESKIGIIKRASKNSMDEN